MDLSVSVTIGNHQFLCLHEIICNNVLFLLDCVQVLLEGGVSPNESGLSSLPPLHTAASGGLKR